MSNDLSRILNIGLDWFDMNENEIENVIGSVNKEMRLSGYNEECV